MNKNLFHIIFSLLLVFAVSDYIWYELIQDEAISIELETENEKEEIKEIREETRASEGKYNSFGGVWYIKASSQFIFDRSEALIENNYNYTSTAFQPLRLFIFHCQLRLPC